MKSYENTHLNIKSWAEEDRPREKLLLKGKASLSDAELLGILIATGIQNMTAVDIAKVILQSVQNDLNQLARLSVKDLAKFKGIGEAKAITIVSALELGRRKKATESAEKPRIKSSSDAYEVLRPYLSDLSHEEFWIILLNRANPKIIFKYALENLASAIILSHNHPSGNLSPSQADRDLTKKLKAAGNNLDIPVLDHLIFTDKTYFSFADEGIL